jgi:hypothetical protein
MSGDPKEFLDGMRDEENDEQDNSTSKYDTANYVISPAEIPQEIAKEFYGFLNKDARSTNLTKNIIKSKKNMACAVVLSKYLDYPEEAIPADIVIQMENIISSIENSHYKSEGALIIKQIFGTHQTTRFEQEDNNNNKKKWGLF